MESIFTRLSDRAFSRIRFFKAGLAGLLALGFYFPAKAQSSFCTPVYTSGCTSQNFIDDFSLTGVAPSVISDLNSGCSAGAYSDQTAAITPVDLMQGGQYSGTVTTGGTNIFYKIWIDFNNDDTFDVSEDMTGNMGPIAFTAPSNFTLAIPYTASVGQHRMRVRLVKDAIGPIDPCLSYTNGETQDYMVNIQAAPPCSGQPVINSVSPAGPINVCAGISQTLSVFTPLASGYSFQWQESTNGGGSWNNVGTDAPLFTFNVHTNALYRVIVTCVASGLSATSGNVSITTNPMVFAPIPYLQDFETWIGNCASFDVPDGPSLSWSNNPSTGDNSWRRDDQGTSASWSVTWGGYSPVSVSGQHSARFASASISNPAPASSQGNLDLYLDCSQQTGDKQLYFYFINPGSAYPADSLNVLLSTDGGNTFSPVGSLYTEQNWKQFSFPIASNSPQTVLRFQADNGNLDFSDMGIDSVYIAPPCAGTVVAGATVPSGNFTGCYAQSTSFTVTGTTLAGNLNFQWQSSSDGVTWTDINGANSPNYKTPVLTASMYYRMYVVCNGSGASDTTAPARVDIALPPYAGLPYFQDFENWISNCDNLEVPGQNWVNNPSTGDNSWRRDDQGTSANWSVTWGGYFPVSVSGQHSARFASAANSGSADTVGNLDLYVDCSQQTGNKQLYFYFINDNFSVPADRLDVLLSTDGGNSFNLIGSVDSAMNWKKASFPVASNSAQTVIRFRAVNPDMDVTDIGLDSVFVALPCTGSVVAGTISAGGTISSCPGNAYSFTATGTTMAGNMTIQWQSSTDGINWTDIAGANTINYAAPPLYDTVYYRMYVVCNGSSQSDTSNVITLNIVAPVYATIPYIQDFENWISRCDNKEVPDASWVNNPPAGDNSWRRDDQGNAASWFQPSSGSYLPASHQGKHSARFHSSMAGFMSDGGLDLLVNCSGPGTKELQFYYINPSGFDELEVWLSDDGGQNFSLLQNYTTEFSWTLKTLPVASTSAQTIIRFRGSTDFMDDMGIDELKVLSPCAGMPVAGTIDSVLPCPGKGFSLTASGTTLATGISYQWQSSANGNTWTNVTGGTGSVLSASISVPTYFRLIVSCGNSSLSDTSAGRFIDTADFYHCYCLSAATSDGNQDIGNVTVESYPSGAVLLNNGNSFPVNNNPSANNVYSDFTGLPPAELIRDSVYKFSASQINQQFFMASKVAVYLDLNQDGIFDPVTERILNKTTSSSVYKVSDTFRIPETAPAGITGMRVVLIQGGNSYIDPCTPYNEGETEDYLVDIKYQPCDGTPNAGVTSISDTSLCPGFPFTLINNSHEYFRTGISWVWQSSADQINWSDITGSEEKDTINQVTGNSEGYYRLKVICSVTNSFTYSNEVKMAVEPPYLCYCASYADGESADLSDIGAFSIGNFVVNTGGPHLNNATAQKGYTAYKGNANIVTLYQDSTYNVSVYHTMKSATHQDARVTLFIDYNNNFVYDYPDELVYTGFTSASNVFLNTTVTVPNTSVTEHLTGMRLILNNDVGPNVPSDQACGTYTSGETEDFVVKIRNKNMVGIGHFANRLQQFDVYPNPSGGRFAVSFKDANPGAELNIKITTVTGRQVFNQKFRADKKDFLNTIDLKSQAAGLYFIELSDGMQKAVKKLIIQ